MGKKKKSCVTTLLFLSIYLFLRNSRAFVLSKYLHLEFKYTISHRTKQVNLIKNM